MSNVVIGELRHRVRLETPLRSPDGAGGVTETWTLLDEVWAGIRPLGGFETVEADGLKARVTHRITVRHRTDVTAEMRFVLGSRRFHIHAVVDPDERKRILSCLAEERTP